MSSNWISVFFLLRVICILQTKVACARTVCFLDVLSFYNSSEACQFYENSFKTIFTENKDLCNIICSLTSEPSYNGIDSDELYEIEEMKVIFSPTFKFTMFKPCRYYYNTDAYITINCEEKKFNERRIGEFCSDSSQCKQGTPYSSCNATSGVCECEEGYILMYNMCFQGNLLLEDACDINEQCNGASEDLFCLHNGSRKICSRTMVPEVSTSSENEKNNEDISLLFGFGMGGITFGVLVCGFLYIYLIWCKKKTDYNRQVNEDSKSNNFNMQKKNAGKNTGETGLGKHTLKVSGEISFNNPSCDQDNVIQSDIYNHLNEDNCVPDIASDYDHACFDNQERDTYNQLGSYNTKNIIVTSEYAESN
ncbi:uncharacterized protein LOC134276596 [Saccostrea cucullata]|uniref:uncharacterized protein LOC134276596 n=1 Tax=Saccostrea cuccullata TaxID=36930 RepID=UPI002ED5D4E4